MMEKLKKQIKKEGFLVFAVPEGRAIANTLARELEKEGFKVGFERVDKERLKVYLCCKECGEELKTKEEIETGLCRCCMDRLKDQNDPLAMGGATYHLPSF